MDKFELSMMRGEQAEQLRANPVFVAAFDDTRKAVMEAWAHLDPGEKDRAAELLLMVKCLDKVKRCIDEHVTTGKLAYKEIEGRKKRLFSFGKAA